MTQFEELARELGVEITYDKHGRYSNRARALAIVSDTVILGDSTWNLEWEEQRSMIKDKFLSIFRYLET